MLPQADTDNISGGTGYLATRRLALLIEYEGTAYAGFQIQATEPTIQGELEEALYKFTGEEIRVRGASRTDSGAHATGQVVDFESASRHSTETFIRALNHYLPYDIRVLEARQVPGAFHSRRDAVSRTYRYSILNRPRPSALFRQHHCWIPTPLNIEEMNVAAQHLIGIHDFRPFAPGHPEDRSSVRQVYRWEVATAPEDKSLLIIECEANGFMQRQIRRTNAVLVETGKGNLPADSVKAILDEGRNSNGKVNIDAIPSLPAKGLCLLEVKYPNPW
ncbi:MAG: tRNA pseudouridine(38-40) synthase TruA [Chloroflexota bacterium]|nr:tRNA pseudouridine(38-40) synthase TruA [Chloroflexota bacterium]